MLICRSTSRFTSKRRALRLLVAFIFMSGIVLTVACKLVPSILTHDLERGQLPPANPVDLSKFFCLNGISPFHEYVDNDFTITDEVKTNLRSKLAKAKDLGASYMRTDFWWGIIQPEKARWEWDLADLVIEEICKAGLEPFPILSYASAWSGDVSPATPEERALFGQYVFEVVNRYKDKVSRWEVWNEPNIRPFWVPTPDPVLYTEVLKVAYTRAKEADPSCTIVGLCTAGADYAFIEKCYKEGCSDYLDAVSFHHYSGRRDEDELLNEIIHVRRIMQRYGDGDKPLLITELGIGSGKNELMSPLPLDEHASWIMKKHLMSIAGGIEQFYYFCMADWSMEPDAIGHWGLVYANLEEKPAAQVYRIMSQRLSNADFLGRLCNVTADPARENDVELLLFASRQGLFAVGWVKQDGEPARIVLPADSNIIMDDVYCSFVKEIEPTSEGVAEIELTHEPCYLMNLSKKVQTLAAVQIEPNPVFLSPGESHKAELTVMNTLPNPVEIDLESLLGADGEQEVAISSPLEKVLLEPGQVKSVVAQISLDEHVPPFTRKRINKSGDQPYSFYLDVVYAEPFEIGMIVGGETGDYTLTTLITNLTERIISGTVRWEFEDKEIPGERYIRDMRPGGMVSIERGLGTGKREVRLDAHVESEEGLDATGSLYLWGQPLCKQGIVVDGEIDEWRDKRIPSVKLASPEHQVVPELSEPIPEQEFSAYVQIFWTQDDLYIGARVIDSSPLVNPHESNEIWRGDSVELYLGFNGPTLNHSYGEHDYQIGISPGDNGENPSVWNWKAESSDAAPNGLPIENAEVASTETNNGYLLEARIPLSSLGEEVIPEKFLGFDIAVNNKINPDAEVRENVLMWSGTGANWRDPSNWGAAIPIPE